MSQPQPSSPPPSAGLEQSSPASTRLFPRINELVPSAFLSIAGSIFALAMAAVLYFSTFNYGAIDNRFLALLYGNLGSILLAYSIVALVARVHTGLWGFFIILYSILDGVLGLFYITTPSGAQPVGLSSSPLVPILGYGGPILTFLGGISETFWFPLSKHGQLGSTRITGANLVAFGGVFLCLVSFWLLLFFGAYAMVAFLGGFALLLIGLMMKAAEPIHPALAKLALVTGPVSCIPILYYFAISIHIGYFGSLEFILFLLFSGLLLTGVVLSFAGGLVALHVSSAATRPGSALGALVSFLKQRLPEILALAGSFAPVALVWWLSLSLPSFAGAPSILWYVFFGSPGQVLFAFAVAQFSDADHRRFWGLVLMIAAAAVGTGMVLLLTYPSIVSYNGSPGVGWSELVFSTALLAAPILCFLGGLLALRRRPNHTITLVP